MEWSEIAFTVAVAVLVLIGVYVRHLRHLVKESYELYCAVKDALKDREITKDELKKIFDEAKDVGEIVLSISQLFARR